MSFGALAYLSFRLPSVSRDGVVGYFGSLPDANFHFWFSIAASIHFLRPLSVQTLRAFSNLSISSRIVAISSHESMASPQQAQAAPMPGTWPRGRLSPIPNFSEIVRLAEP